MEVITYLHSLHRRYFFAPKTVAWRQSDDDWACTLSRDRSRESSNGYNSVSGAFISLVVVVVEVRVQAFARARVF